MDSSSPQAVARPFDVWWPALAVLVVGIGVFAAWRYAAGDARTAQPTRAKPMALQGALIDPGIEHGDADKPPPAKLPNPKPNQSLEVTMKKRYGDATPVTFDILSGFFYEDPNKMDDEVVNIGPDFGETNPIPENILAYNGKRVAVRGFMSPIKTVDGKVRTLVLVKNRMFCCFGQMPQMNEWIYVEMKKGKTAEYYNDLVVTVVGVLSIGEKRKDGMVMSIYRMEAELLEGPLDL